MSKKSEEEIGEADWEQYTPTRLRKQIATELSDVPIDWDGYTKQQKVEKLVLVVKTQLVRVRSSNFDTSKCSEVAALALEAMMEMADFFTEAESNARTAKLMSEYIENETANTYVKQAVGSEKRMTETALKRLSSSAGEVKDAKIQAINLDKDFKKWKCIFEILQDAHIFFRNLGRAI